MNTKIIGIDLAKQIFQIQILEADGSVGTGKTLRRHKLLDFMAQQAPSLVVLEACGTANYWARQFERLGHTVKQIAPQYVAPFRCGNKNDRNDALAIAEAATRPTMRYVPNKSLASQDIQCLHRVRQRLVTGRTALLNQIRGLLAEYGIVIPQGAHRVRQALPLILEDADNELTLLGRQLFNELREELVTLEERIQDLDRRIRTLNADNESVQRLLEIPGIGPLSASMLAITLGNGNAFKNGRHFSAYLGLVPKQHSSGGKERLLGLSKRGDAYLRGLLIHGARAIVHHCRQAKDKFSRWVTALVARRGVHKAIAAVANKNARRAWALVHSGERYRFA